ncbi:hypothetical protein Taro_029823 [Colocasia esculenta]|uniref:pectinesterase n=1 Tax=Colocasia esculenta TaxID=4460 RepID=A0A843VUC8_COLES|nr:hypothetical protein [Colocasia esculenta]
MGMSQLGCCSIVVIFFLGAVAAVFMAPVINAADAASVDPSTAILITVDQSGRGDYQTIQDAIDAVPSNNTELVFISIKPGVYRQAYSLSLSLSLSLPETACDGVKTMAHTRSKKLPCHCIKPYLSLSLKETTCNWKKAVVPVDKPFITLSGTNATSTANTIITWSDGGNTFQSATVTILASDFVGRYLTIQNTYGSGAQAVALRVSGDRAAFYACRILSYQDTLLDDSGRHYFSNCYIEGATDFICGNALSLFEASPACSTRHFIHTCIGKCHLHSSSKNGGAVTAQSRSSPTDNTGYSFFRCRITGKGPALLGRPWRPYSRVVFAYTYMSSAIVPRGWDDWGDSSNQRTVFYGQYNCFGPGAKLNGRATWTRALSSGEAAPFMSKSMIDGETWLRRPPTHFRKASTLAAQKLVAGR